MRPNGCSMPSMASYRFVPAWYDYGPRAHDALGLLYHMAEGGGTVGYLDKNGAAPPRGVSVHVVFTYAGETVQMLPWAHASGSVNPRDRSTNKAYYGHAHLVDVLGMWWADPNSVTLSAEIEGHASEGPNPAQVKAAIAWGRDMRTQFGTLRGAIGHADQTDTKACPGTSAAMKAIFDGVGGHGRWMIGGHAVDSYPVPKVPTEAYIAVNTWLYVSSGLTADAGNVKITPHGRWMPYHGEPVPGKVRAVEYVGADGTHSGRVYFVHAADATQPRPIVFPAPDCTAKVNAATAPLTARITAGIAALEGRG